MISQKKFALVLAVAGCLLGPMETNAQSNPSRRTVPEVGKTEVSAANTCQQDGGKEAVALLVLLSSVQKQVSSAALGMPADKYSFRPTDGEFQGVRSFGQQVIHLAATNDILAAAALGEPRPADAGDEAGPDSVRTKNEILAYLSDSFLHLNKAVNAFGSCGVGVKSSPVSPLKESTVTRESLVVEAMVHAFDHYGQMVEYLRMNGIVPPASLP